MVVTGNVFWRSGSALRISKKTNCRRLAMPVGQALPQIKEVRAID
jgi:hypothetical protein